MTEGWWRDAVVYQIHPRSFADADGDGLGDLDGPAHPPTCTTGRLLTSGSAWRSTSRVTGAVSP